MLYVYVSELSSEQKTICGYKKKKNTQPKEMIELEYKEECL